jgi:hypothetical protein
MKAHWFCGLTEDPGKMTWAAAKVKFFFFFFGEEKGDGKYQTWCLKEDLVRKGLTVDVGDEKGNLGETVMNFWVPCAGTVCDKRSMRRPCEQRKKKRTRRKFLSGGWRWPWSTVSMV